MKLMVSIVLICLFLSINGFSQDTISVPAYKDTYINTVIPDTYQGSTQSFIAAGWTYGGQYGQGRSLIGFDLCDLPNDFTLYSATLYLYYDNIANHAGHTTNGGNQAKLFKITSYWDENTTWTSQPSIDNLVFVGLPAASTANENYSIDVTSIVNNYLFNGQTDIGFYFRLDNEQIYRSLVFSSHDHTDTLKQPRLELVFSTDSSWCYFTPNSVGTIDSTSVQDVDTTICDNDLFVPNVFTPNDDLKNDRFKVKMECPVDHFHIKIYNRWGKLVYETDDQYFEWDGIYKSKGLSEGVYYYVLSYDNSAMQGIVTLIR